MIEINLPDFKLQAKKRPRLGRHGNVYSPTAEHETTLAWLIRAQVGSLVIDGPVKLTLRCKFARGDLDNYVKTVCDALQKSQVIRNDSQVIEIMARRVSEPGLHFILEEI